MNQKVLVRVLLGVLALLFVAGMIVQFTPNLQSLRPGGQHGTPALKVNGQTVTAEDLQRVQQRNQLLSLAQGGVLGQDFKTVIVNTKVREALLSAASSDIKVSRKEVSDQIDQIRQQNGLTKTQDYTKALQQNGLTDASLREQLRSGLAVQQKVKQLQAGVPKATDAEARAYYDLNDQPFQSEPKIAAREIVLADEKKAKDLLAQLKGGADFAKLATQNSLENKERGGALAAVEGGKIKPVGAVALPQEASAAAFALTKGGLTDVVKSGGKYYIVKVEQFIPAGKKPFEEAKSAALTAATEAKKNAAVEQWLDGLEAKADVQVLDKANWNYFNPNVASVDGKNVKYSEVLSAMLNQPQFGQFVQQGGEQAASLINSFFKPQMLSTVIEGYAAPTIAKNLGLPLVGSRQEQRAALLAYGGRDAKVTDADLQAAYQQQKEQFATPGSANVSEASFKDKAKALAFRQSFPKAGGDFIAAASKLGGTVNEQGTVSSGDNKLSPAAVKAVFAAGRLAPAGEGSLSDVVESSGRYSVFLVKDLVRPSSKTLSEVQAQLRPQVLQQKRTTLGQQFIQAQLKKLKVENKLSEVLKAEEALVAKNAPKTPASSQTGTGSAPPATKTPAQNGNGTGGTAPKR